LITHRFPVERAQGAYELISGKSHEPFLGVVIQYSETCDVSNTLTLVSEPPVARKQSIDCATVGLLGAGGFATSTLIPALKASSDTTLVSVCAATGSHAQHAARKFGFRDCTTDEAQILGSQQINTIVIATRHHLHARQVLDALKHGKNVFCEKPLCLTEDELRAIVRSYLEVQASKRPVLMVGFNRRFAPMTDRLKSFLSSVTEPLAIHYRVNAGYLPPDHWVNDREQGGGRILGEVCHFVDLLMFLAGSPIMEVMGRPLAGSSRYSGDNVLISLRFANGSEGTISYLASGDRSFSKERIEVFGGGISAVLEDFRRLELVRNGRKNIIRSRWRQDKGHQAEWNAFVRSLQQSDIEPIPLEEIVGSTLATIRINDSAAIGTSLSVNAAAFIESARGSSDLSPTL
jgi:predicted dehydrogenase